MYYNTTNEKAGPLNNYKGKAKTQDEYIYSLFKDGAKLSSSMIFPLVNFPQTSIRRSLNTLMNEGKIDKLDVKVFGMYGRKEHLYKKK